MRTLLHISPILIAATLVGCQDEPAFELRWAIDPSASLGESAKPSLASPTDCSNAGVMDVRIITRDAFGLVVDSRKRPCFSSRLSKPAATIAGPELPPGPYAVEVRGVRRDGGVWSDVLTPLDELVPDPGCVPDLEAPASEQNPICPLDALVCDCAFVQVAEGRTVRLDDFVLDAPPQCQDGIDNDLDGLVDMFDPACRLGRSRGELYAREDVEVVANAQLVFRPSLLHDNPLATCGSLGISRFLVTLDESSLTEPICSNVLGNVFQASGMILPGESHVVRVVAVDSAREPLTTTKEFVIDAPQGGGGRFTFDFDFGPEDFLEPIVAPTRIAPHFAPLEDAPDYDRECGPDNVAGGRLYLPELRVRLLGPRGKPLSPAAKLEDGTPLDGEAVVPLLVPGSPPGCSLLTTEPLSWGEHLIEIEAFSPEGEVCFSNVGDPRLVAPGESRIAIRRVFPIPASCRDCDTDADCVTPQGDPAGAICEEGACRPTCTVQDDCPAGTRCRAGLCEG